MKAPEATFYDFMYFNRKKYPPQLQIERLVAKGNSSRSKYTKS